VLGVSPTEAYTLPIPDLLDLLRAKVKLEEEKARRQKAAQDRAQNAQNAQRRGPTIV